MSHPGDLLSAYFDDELTSTEREAVALHLDGCAECRTELESVQSAAVGVRGLPVIDPPSQLAPAPAPWRLRRRWQTVGAIGVGAAAIASLVVGIAVIGNDEAPQLVASATVPVVLPGMDPVPEGDRTVSGQQRVQAIDAALRAMPEIDEMEMTSDEMYADVEVMMGDEPMKVKAGMWDGVAADYIAIMNPAEGVVGLYVANEAGMTMTFFYCEHSWYRVEARSGRTPDISAVAGLRRALGCTG